MCICWQKNVCSNVENRSFLDAFLLRTTAGAAVIANVDDGDGGAGGCAKKTHQRKQDLFAIRALNFVYFLFHIHRFYPTFRIQLRILR